MMQLVIAAESIKQSIRTFSLRRWIARKVGSALGRFFGWAFSFRQVQEAVIDQVRCGTPIGRALVLQMEEIADKAADEAVSDFEVSGDVEADNVKGLDGYVDSCISDYMRHTGVSSDDVTGLDDDIEKAIDEWLDTANDEQLATLRALVAQRMSY